MPRMRFRFTGVLSIAAVVTLFAVTAAENVAEQPAEVEIGLEEQGRLEQAAERRRVVDAVIGGPSDPWLIRHGTKRNDRHRMRPLPPGVSDGP